MATSKRRSDRIMLTVRLRIPGTDAAGENIETADHVVRTQPLAGTNRKIYGVRYGSHGTE
jgi:hypothetical protein